MKLLIETDVFSNWFTGLRDPRAMAAINARLRHVELGSFGDFDVVGDEVKALRIDHGPGYRVYVAERSFEVVLLLAGDLKPA